MQDRQSEARLRVMHVVGRMVRGGVETWLMHVLRHIDRDRIQMDFIVHSTEPGDYDDEIRELGSELFPCLGTRQPVVYARNFRRLMRKHGPIDVLHSHVHYYSGYILLLARWAGIPKRIAHTHNTSNGYPSGHPTLPRKLYIHLTKRLIFRYATHGLAASAPAAHSFYGENWQRDPRWSVMLYTLDLTPFQRKSPRDLNCRTQFGIPAGSFVIGHVGRFVKQKNHEFLVAIAAQLLQRHPEAYFLLIGDGPLRPAIEQQVCDAGIADRVVFAGVRSDVPQLMLDCMDVFLLPSKHEGLGIVLVEAQSAGLPCVISDVVPAEGAIVPELIHTLSLNQPAIDWAHKILPLAQKHRSPVDQFRALSAVEASPFNISSNIATLTQLYHD